MKIKPQRRLLCWIDFTPELIKDMWDIIQNAQSLTLKSKEAIVLEFNVLGTDNQVTTYKELIEWSKEMLKKYPKYLLVPSCLRDNKIICYISKIEP